MRISTVRADDGVTISETSWPKLPTACRRSTRAMPTTGSAKRAAVRLRPAYHCPRPGHRKDRNPAVYGERPRRTGAETVGVLKSAGV